MNWNANDIVHIDKSREDDFLRKKSQEDKNIISRENLIKPRVILIFFSEEYGILGYVTR